ncbi:MAG: aldo/keto reductase [Nocardioidaceae bacterium]|nr:aldo/keto reductase [Nocardioidaceae bacterium]
MKYVKLGRSGLIISRMALGTMNFGAGTDRAESFRMMEHAHEAGINFFDTGIRYGGEGEYGFGATEEIIGDWFAQGGGRRERTVLSTKVFQATDSWPNNEGLSALNIRRACDHSLRRLRTDYLDVFQLHHVDRNTPWEEIWQALDVLVSQGKIIYAGSSNFAGWHIARAQSVAESRHLLGFVCEQSLYNLMVRDIEREVLPAAEAFGMGVLTWSPLNGGLLGGVLRKEREGRARRTGWAAHTVDRHRPTLQAYEDLCQEGGFEPAVLAIAWQLHQPSITAPVIGPRSVAQLQETLPALDVSLSDEVLDRLEGIFPGHRTAPEAYAW